MKKDVVFFILIIILNVFYKKFEYNHTPKETVKIEKKEIEDIKIDDDKKIVEEVSKEWEEQEKAELALNEEELENSDDINLEEKVTLENIEYEIKPGDTISDLSSEYKIKSDYIYANNIDKNLKVLQVGKKINIPTEDGIFYTVKKGDTLEKISKRFAVNIDTIKNDNNVENLLIGTQIFLREPKVSKYLIGVNSRTGKIKSVSGFCNPLLAMSVTSSFGTRNHPVLRKVLAHGGIDLKARTGTRIMAAKGGVVSFAGRMSGYGKIVIIKHENGYETRYAHLSRISVKKGQKVSSKQFIALSGATGRVTGPHLHFEIRKNGKIVNPLKYLKM